MFRRLLYGCIVEIITKAYILNVHKIFEIPLPNNKIIKCCINLNFMLFFVYCIHYTQNAIDKCKF